MKKNKVLNEEPGSSKPIFKIRALYGLNTGLVRFKYRFCLDETGLFCQEPGVSRKLNKNQVFEKKNYKLLGSGGSRYMYTVYVYNMYIFI